MRPVARKENIVVQDAAHETLVYDLNINQAFLLNETSAFVWRASDGTRGIAEIAEALARHNRQPANIDIVLLAIDRLKKDNLMANPERLPVGFDGLSRREVIKKIGLGTMIALPLVSSIFAPTSVHAASSSLVANGDPCGSASQCASNCCGPTFPGNPSVCLISGNPPGNGCLFSCQCVSNNCHGSPFGNVC